MLNGFVYSRVQWNSGYEKFIHRESVLVYSSSSLKESIYIKDVTFLISKKYYSSLTLCIPFGNE